MKPNIAILIVAALVALTPSSTAQDLTFFFSAGDFSEEPDRFGNTHTIGPEDAILELPFGHEDLLPDFIELDNKWLIYDVPGNTLLVSNNPAGSEDSPEIFMDITVAIGGTYEVILNFLDNNDFPGEGPILAALGDGALIDYSELNSIRATGGTSPAYPVSGNTTAGTMWWQSVSLGEAEAEAGGVIRVRIDDAPNPVPDIGAFEYAASVFQGITLRVIELGGAISEIQVSPGVFDWTTDVSGNQFKTGPVDASLTQDQWLTVNANSAADNLWNIREGLGSYGPILESFPLSGEDATPLQTSVIFASGGTYDVFFSLGDTGAVDADENIQNSTPLNFALEGEDFVRWHANDGEYKGTPGYNDYEMSVGQITVSAGDQVNFLVDDVQDGTASRSVYLGMRLVLRPQVELKEFQVSPGVFDWATDLSGNQFKTGPVDTSLTQDQWLTVNANSAADNLWNIREGLGSYGPILESFPLSGEDATPLQTSVIFASGGTFDVFFSLGDTGAVSADENIQNSTPLNFALEGEDFVRWHANDGEYKGTPGYNDYEMSVGQITVSAGDQVNFLIDDVQDGTASRSVYLGMRFAVAESSPAFGITIVNNGDGKVTLTWTGSLQGSDNVTGPYSDIAGDSPLTVNADQTVRIYRVK